MINTEALYSKDYLSNLKIITGNKATLLQLKDDPKNA
jgi:hypothetical protein